jgi:hypothetical protein
LKFPPGSAYRIGALDPSFRHTIKGDEGRQEPQHRFKQPHGYSQRIDYQ